MNKIMSAVFAALLVVCTVLSVSAADGDGSGGGTGDGNGEKHPTVVTSSISDGETDVDVNVKIELVFSNNVVNIAVKENNINCFSLTADDGSQGSFSVLMGDDQIDPSTEVKRTVVIACKNLKAETKYTLKISKDLSAKNGNKMDEDYELSFTTGKKPKTNTTSSDDPTIHGGNITEPSVYPKGGSSDNNNGTNASDKTSTTKDAGKTSSTTKYVGITTAKLGFTATKPTEKTTAKTTTAQTAVSLTARPVPTTQRTTRPTTTVKAIVPATESILIEDEITEEATTEAVTVSEAETTTELESSAMEVFTEGETTAYNTESISLTTVPVTEQDQGSHGGRRIAAVIAAGVGFLIAAAFGVYMLFLRKR
ncbi:MAG: Ig-like domain-containing protein [Clostridiales bacterium]|nr:Ig-like domain-containing protein [Clostridiales bacterium]